VRVGILGAPRPVPGRLAPALAGGLVVALALGVFVAAGWPLAGWALAAVLWVAAQAFAFAMARLPLGPDNLGASGVAGVGRMVRAVGVLGVILVVAVSQPAVALAAGLLYALAYTAELATTLVVYFAASPTR
jgi:hypothetical protein